MKTNYFSRPFFFGIVFTLIIALISMALVKLPVLSSIGALAVALIIGIIYRQFLGYPEYIRPGITFSAKKLLRFAIILYGFKLNLQLILSDGWIMLLLGALVIFLSFALMHIMNKFMKGNDSIMFLLAAGTGICGAAAISAVSSITKSKEEDTAIAIGLISVVGTVGALIYTFLGPVFDMQNTVYGVWSGLSLHEIAQVVLAGGAGGDDGMAMALLSKLSRVFLLIPVSFIIMYFVAKKQHSKTEEKVDIPYFLIFFILVAILNSFVAIPTGLRDFIDQFTTLLMVMAMVGLGLSVSLRSIREKAMKPLLALIILSVVISLVSLYAASFF
ncbi:MAG TPA: putative sulfate exporter family transporter [Candidatus Jeotgalicoccus stercoravium]|nr:putative sulfate exporter family transporter [Candidatus Jeotgalicoccus stercoravium]